MLLGSADGYRHCMLLMSWVHSATAASILPQPTKVHVRARRRRNWVNRTEVVSSEQL